jgi:hypothetical protein
MIEPSVIDPTTLVATVKITNTSNNAKQVMCQRTTNNLLMAILVIFAGIYATAHRPI